MIDRRSAHEQTSSILIDQEEENHELIARLREQLDGRRKERDEEDVIMVELK